MEQTNAPRTITEPPIALSGLNVKLGDFHPPACGVSRAEWHDKAWALYHAKTFNDHALHKVSIHTMRAVFDSTYDALFVSPNDKLRGSEAVPLE